MGFRFVQKSTMLIGLERSKRVIHVIIANQSVVCHSERKGKERKSIYMAPLYSVQSQGAQTWNHIVLPANCTMLAFPS